MAKLCPTLVQSMTEDLLELDNIARNMVSGTTKLLSWRYPMKQSIDVNCQTVLHVRGNMQYILLLELTIDRLHLLINEAVKKLNTLLNSSGLYTASKNVCISESISLSGMCILLWKKLQILLSPKETKYPTPHRSKMLTMSTFASQTEQRSYASCESCHVAMETFKQIILIVQKCASKVLETSAVDNRRKNSEHEVWSFSQYGVMNLWCKALQEDITALITLAELSKKRFNQLKSEMTECKSIGNNLTRSIDVLNKTLDLERSKCIDVTKKLDISKKTQSALTIKCEESDIIIRELQETVEKYKAKLECKNAELLAANTNKEEQEKLKDTFDSKLNEIDEEKRHWMKCYDREVEQCDALKIKLKETQQYESSLQKQANAELENQKILHEQKYDELFKRNSELQENITKLESKVADDEIRHGTVQAEMKEEYAILREKLKKSKDREIALVQNPDLNGPLPDISQDKLNPLQDMKRQIKANKIRISLLQEQNNKLLKTVSKLKSMTEL